MIASPVPRRFSPTPRNPLKTLNLAGCLVGCSPVPSVVRNPLKTLGSPVLAGPLSRNPHTPYRPRGRGRSLGSAYPLAGLLPFGGPFSAPLRLPASVFIAARGRERMTPSSCCSSPPIAPTCIPHVMRPGGEREAEAVAAFDLKESA